MKFRQPQFFTDLVVANAQLLNLLVRQCTCFRREVHAVADHAVECSRSVWVRPELRSPRSIRRACELLRVLHKNSHLLENSVPCGKTSRRRLYGQQLRTQEFVERRFRLTANTADELLSIPERLAELGNVAHHAFDAAACLCAFLVVHEMDDCDFPRPPSCIWRRVTLIFGNAWLCPDWRTALYPCSPAPRAG